VAARAGPAPNNGRASVNDDQLRKALWKLWEDQLDLSEFVADPDLRAECLAGLRERCQEGEWYPNAFISHLVRDWYLSDEAIANGDGIASVVSVVEWLNDTLGQHIE
jgi:hypothetical protein